MSVTYQVIFYEDRHGDSAVLDYMNSLNNASDKNSRIKIIEGTDLWELRPIQDRIIFAYWKDDMFILLHHFAKKTQKTPHAEIEKAFRYLIDWQERHGE